MVSKIVFTKYLTLHNSHFPVCTFHCSSIWDSINRSSTSYNSLCNRRDAASALSSSFCGSILVDLSRRGLHSVPQLVYKGPEENVAEDPTPRADDHVITVPVHLKNRLERKMIKESTRGHQRMKIVEKSRAGNSSKAIINCKLPIFNYYLGQSYARGEEIPLASKNWHHRKAAGDWFRIKPVVKPAAFGFSTTVKDTTFEDLGIKAEIVTRLHDNKALKPTLVQELAIPQIMKGSHNLITAETGCGKTLAYMIPLIQQILVEKKRRLRRGANQPLAIILVPSHELASQIFYVATKLSYGLGVNVKLLQHGNLGSKIATPASDVIDLLISTIHVVSTLKSAGVYGINKVHHVVLDEADTLLDDSFSPDVINFLRSFNFYPGQHHVTQLSLVSATLPKTVESTVAELVPEESMNRISTPNIHCVMSHVPQNFLRLRKSQKPEKLLEIVKIDLETENPLIIFCNTTKTCDWLRIMLTDNNIPCIAVHGETRPMHRKGLMDKYQNGNVNIMICTDLGSRGINTIRTRHVLNYDFPMFTADYIHRCGRTGRVGSTGKCKVTNFIARRFEFQVVQEIERSVRQDVSLSKVDANIKRLLNARYGMHKPITGNDDDEDDDE